MNVTGRFGENLRRARPDAGLSQEETGIRASLHRTEIGLLERGERIPRIDTAIKLAVAVDVSLSELLVGIEWKSGSSEAGSFAVSTPPERHGAVWLGALIGAERKQPLQGLLTGYLRRCCQNA